MIAGELSFQISPQDKTIFRMLLKSGRKNYPEYKFDTLLFEKI